jgi:hypothetical protein
MFSTGVNNQNKQDSCINIKGFHERRGWGDMNKRLFKRVTFALHENIPVYIIRKSQ